MRTTPPLIEAKLAGTYVVHVCFEDGLAADVDLSYLLDYGGVFEPLRDTAYFRSFRIDDDSATIIWPNDADIAPETLYLCAQQHARVAGSSASSD
jgi:Protein of unknown function (DUF2442)